MTICKFYSLKYYNETLVVVNRIDTFLDVLVDDIVYGEVLNVNVSVNSYATGYVNITVGNVTERVDLINGKANAVFTTLNAGLYKVNVGYCDEGNFKPVFKTLN